MQPASSPALSSHFLNIAELGPLGFGSSLTLSFPFCNNDNGDGDGAGEGI